MLGDTVLIERWSFFYVLLVCQWFEFDAVSCFYIFNAQASPCKRTLLALDRASIVICHAACYSHSKKQSRFQEAGGDVGGAE